MPQLSIDDDIYHSIGVDEVGATKSTAEPVFRKVPKHFQIKYSSPYKDMEAEASMLMLQKEKFLLKILFVGLLFLSYGLW